MIRVPAGWHRAAPGPKATARAAGVRFLQLLAIRTPIGKKTVARPTRKTERKEDYSPLSGSGAEGLLP